MHQLPPDFYMNKTRGFIEQLVYARDEYKDVMTAAMAVSRIRDSFTTVPHILATAEGPESGKTTIAADIPQLLAYVPWKVSKNTTTDALRNKYLERIRPNIIADDIGKIFGDSGQNGKQSLVYALLIDCYREDGVVSVSRNGSTQDLKSYGMAFMNGMKNAVPHDLFTRSIWFQMEPAPSGLALRDALDESVRADAKILKEALHSWACANSDECKKFMRNEVRFIHPKLEKRKRQIWGPLFAVAHCAGGDWPRRIFDAFVSIALEAGEKPVLIPEHKALLDVADIIMRRDITHLLVPDAVRLLRDLPTGDYYRKTDDAHLTRSVLPEALGASKTITARALTGEYAGQRGRGKGWDAPAILKAAADLRDVLYPPMEIEPDESDAEMAFQPIGAK